MIYVLNGNEMVIIHTAQHSTAQHSTAVVCTCDRHVWLFPFESYSVLFTRMVKDSIYVIEPKICHN
jgi:hypothetical protein